MTALAVTTPILAARHGFFGRQGGVSAGLYTSLNCGIGSADRRENVVENRRLALAELGGQMPTLATVHQTHSVNVVTISSQTQAAQRPEGDAMVTALPGIALGILTADCAPILFHDPTKGVIGAAHAGWKGALGGITGHVLTAMEALGADRSRVIAVIGPCIGPEAYEVGPEFRAAFLDHDPAAATHFRPGRLDRQMFDLPGFLLSRLVLSGIGRAEWTGHCTFSESERFFSFRRSTHRAEPDYGREVALIAL